MNASALRLSRMKSSEFMALINKSTVLLRMVLLFLFYFAIKTSTAVFFDFRKTVFLMINNKNGLDSNLMVVNEDYFNDIDISDDDVNDSTRNDDLYNDCIDVKQMLDDMS